MVVAGTGQGPVGLLSLVIGGGFAMPYANSHGRHFGSKVGNAQLLQNKVFYRHARR